MPFLNFTYPGHFLAFVAVVTAAPKELVFPLSHVTVPPTANDATGSGWEPPPVLAPLTSVHPLMLTVLAAFPVMVVQIVLPFGPAAPATPGATAPNANAVAQPKIATLLLIFIFRSPP